MGFSLRAKEDTWLKMNPAQGSNLPDAQRSFFKATTTFPLAAYQRVDDHLLITLGKNEQNQQVFVRGRTNWYVYEPAVEVLQDGMVVTIVRPSPPETPTPSQPTTSAVGLRVSEAGLTLIKTFEGLRLTAYQDSVGVWTIGYGTTRGVTPGMTITEQQALDFLRQDVSTFEQAVADLVTYPVTTDQFSALVSFVYNLGPGSLQQSTLLKLLNQGNTQGAAEQFLRWNKAGGQVLAGLTQRRKAERALFLSQDFTSFLMG